MASKIQVRFHLGAGKNFMKWQVKEDGRVSYFDPETTNLVLINAKLRNQIETAKKINQGANKTVCAWVECDRSDCPRSGNCYRYLNGQALIKKAKQSK